MDKHRKQQEEKKEKQEAKKEKQALSRNFEQWRNVVHPVAYLGIGSTAEPSFAWPTLQGPPYSQVLGDRGPVLLVNGGPYPGIWPSLGVNTEMHFHCSAKFQIRTVKMHFKNIIKEEYFGIFQELDNILFTITYNAAHLWNDLVCEVSILIILFFFF